MDLDLTPEQKTLKDTARKFFERECPTSLVREMEKDPQGYPPELWKKAIALGWMGLGIPKQYGGAGGGIQDLGVLFEELGRAAAPLPLLTNVAYGSLPILRHGTAEQKRSYLPKLAKGELFMTLALTEADAAFDGAYQPEAVATKASLMRGKFTVRGAKMFVENAHIADTILTVARTRYSRDKGNGLSVLLVDGASEDLTKSRLKVVGSDPQFEVVYDGVTTPEGAVLGKRDRGWAVVDDMLQRAAVLQCAQVVGAAERALEMAVDYSKVRVNFGRPIGSFQVLQHFMADMRIWTDACRLLTYEALWSLDQGEDATASVSAAKAFCSEWGKRTLELSHQIHGGLAYMMEFDLQLWVRRVKSWELKLGSAPYHYERIAEALKI